MSRIAKQLIYGAIYIMFFAGIGTGMYFLFLKPAPSCFDKKQNQNETGIDCGGVCGTVCLPAGLQKIEIINQVKVFSLAAGRIELLAKIQNANAGLAARSFGYHFDLYGEDNTFIRAIPGTSFIYAQEIKYIGEFADIAGAKKVVRAEFKIDAPDWVNANDFRRPSLAVQDKNINVDSKRIQATGKVANEDTMLLQKVMIAAVFYDRFGLAAGFSQTELENLMPGESRAFAIAHPSINGFDPIRTEIIPYAERR